MNISTVNELIQSLESAGELSIREQKFLKLAKAFKQLAEENVGLRPLIAENWNMRDLLRQLMAGRPGGVYFNKWEKLIVRVLNETPATNRIVAGIKADAIDEAAVELDRVDTVASTRVIGFKLREFAKQLREGAK
ncbi:TPA: hypothetical protein MAB35_000375 [Klebsiella quasipneumoniae subsp. similipneumoniae]|uniref:hypothetical protein n=1 Tax=Klebsiella TaxID=570 RepID=UPI000FBD3D8F|nr:MULTISPECIES: hypothetical protein [Klebsiella]HBS1068456.1 hypothetical protein [Klebsiella quasipneumoniae subsp. similipneumoniae]MCM2207580.1 hypothetical protein [Klebsiella quasipneumoniae]RRE63006.1 hypothetical protein EAO01_14405 [Klebsiella pneumoniae]UKL34606.1 hypothetical protein L7G48_11635 [Klebsiella pneumoniae]HBS1085174.1 hypothetical protein [Klebsiella quasipneumoniae subsp. similipneumoniae]